MLTPAQVGKIAHVSGQTIRNHAKNYADLLSPETRGKSNARLFNDEDVKILCTITALSAAGMPPQEIVTRIRNDEVPPFLELSPTVTSNDIQDTPNELQSATSESPQSTLKTGQNEAFATVDVHPIYIGRFEAIERRFEAQDRKRDIWLIGTGVWLGMVLMGAIFFAVWLVVNGGY